MSDEQEKKDALIRYEPKALTLREELQLLVALKREEFEQALKRGDVKDPFSWTAFFIALAVSAASTTASYLISKALAPKPSPQRVGEMSGEVQGLMRSEQGILINEIYGGDPGDGKGGVKFPATIIFASPLRKTVSVTRQETGGGKFGGGGGTQEIENVVYDLDFAAMGGRAPLLLKREWANTDKIIDLDKRGVYEGEAASNTFTAPYQLTDDTTASDGKEATLQNANPATSAVQFNSVQSNGAVTRELTIYYVNTGTISGEVIVNGGAPQAVSFLNSSNSRSSIVVNVALNNGANTIKIRNLSLTLNLRIDRIFCFPGFSETDRTTGILDPTTPVDVPYNPALPPDPQTNYLPAISRHNEVPILDTFGAFSGKTNLGGYADFEVYRGYVTQLQDPVIEAATDLKFGAGSTPAYRNRAYVRHSNFQLTRWAGVMPNISQQWENEVYKNLAQIYGQWCDRVKMIAGDYDFSGVVSAKCRGFLVSGRRYRPSEPMTETEEVYDIFFTEPEGQLVALLHSNAPTITIPESKIGWLEDDPSEDSLPTLDTGLANEMELPRRVDVKFIDPDREYEPNTQGEARQVTLGESQRLLEVSITLTQAEARAVATRKLYRDYVRGTKHRFTLSWEYLYIYPGYIINTTKNSIAISMQLTKMSGAISILDCDAEDIETAVLTQATAADTGVFELPPVPIPQMTIAALMDTPLLRDRDETENNGIGFYAAATPRTGEGVWTGASLYVQKIGWERIADFTLPATMGRQVLANGSGVALPTGSVYVFDNTNTVTVDLYGTTQTLSSASEADVLNGQNACLIGDEVIQFTTAAQVGGQPNRWTLSGLLRGRRGTEYATTTHVLNERFIFLNEAVKFIPMNAFDLNRPHDYRMVSNGQSLDDAATIEDFTWTGRGQQPLSTINHRGTRDSGNDLLIEFEGRTRVGGGLRSYQAGAVNEETEEYRIQILNSGSVTLPNGKERLLTFSPGLEIAAFLTSETGFTGVTHNTLESFPSVNTARSLQEVHQANNYIEGNLKVDFSLAAGWVAFGLQVSGGVWQGLAAALVADRLAGGFTATLDTAATIPYLVILEEKGTSGQKFSVYEYGTLLFSASNKVGEPDYDVEFGWSETAVGIGFMRVRFNFVGSTITIQKTHTRNTPFRTVAKSKRGGVYPYFAVCVNPGDAVESKVQDVRMTCRPFPKTIYSADQQVEDFGSAQSSIQMDIWQHSRSLGPGVKTRVTL